MNSQGNKFATMTINDEHQTIPENADEGGAILPMAIHDAKGIAINQT